MDDIKLLVLKKKFWSGNDASRGFLSLTSLRRKREIGGQRLAGGENSSIDLLDNIFITRTPNIAFLVGYPWVPFLG